MKEKISKEVKIFWHSLNLQEKNEFLLLSYSFRDSLKQSSKGATGKYVEIPTLKKSANSNIYTYSSPWDDKKLSFEFIKYYRRLSNVKETIIYTSNLGSAYNYKHLIESWVKYINEFEIMKFK